jgi:hypothetical protein
VVTSPISRNRAAPAYGVDRRLARASAHLRRRKRKAGYINAGLSV